MAWAGLTGELAGAELALLEIAGDGLLDAAVRAEGGFTWAGQADASAVQPGQAAADIEFQGTAHGTAGAYGTAAGDLQWQGAGAAGAEQGRRAQAQYEWSGSAAGNMLAGARAEGGFLWLDAADASITSTALAFAAVEWVGSAQGVAFMDELQHPSRVQFCVPRQPPLAAVPAQVDLQVPVGTGAEQCC